VAVGEGEDIPGRELTIPAYEIGRHVFETVAAVGIGLRFGQDIAGRELGIRVEAPFGPIAEDDASAVNRLTLGINYSAGDVQLDRVGRGFELRERVSRGEVEQNKTGAEGRPTDERYSPHRVLLS
jgi:hypothetical protein